jgi:DinB superfamily
MRWQPDSPICAECGFDWQLARQEAIDLVAQAPDAATASITRIHDPTRCTGDLWSPSMYLWHLVDVLRIGTERLLTLSYDPGRGIACWDENALAEARRYQQLSPAVGLIVLRSAAQAWVTTAAAAPADVQVRHPRFGVLGSLEIIRRNAHEVHHHLLDINRADAPR